MESPRQTPMEFGVQACCTEKLPLVLRSSCTEKGGGADQPVVLSCSLLHWEAILGSGDFVPDSLRNGVVVPAWGTCGTENGGLVPNRRSWY
eukprot:837269-Rhodomonas_salina.1